MSDKIRKVKTTDGSVVRVKTEECITALRTMDQGTGVAFVKTEAKEGEHIRKVTNLDGDVVFVKTENQ